MRRIAVIAVSLCALLGASGAQAAWTPTRVVASGVDPELGVSDSGAAAIVTTGRDAGRGPVGVVRVAVMAAGGRFGAPRVLEPVVYRASGADSCAGPAPLGRCAVAPTGVSVGAGTTVGVLYAYKDPMGQAAPPAVLQILRGQGRRILTRALVPFGPDGGTLTQGAIMSTSTGAIVAAANGYDFNAVGHDPRYSYYRVAVVGRGGSDFAARNVRGFGLADVSLNHPNLVADAAGGTFLYPNGYAINCWILAYRPPRGRFRLGYVSEPCARGDGFTIQAGFAAWGDGFDALLSDSSTAGQAAADEESLVLQVGRFGHLGPPRTVQTDGDTVSPPDTGLAPNPPLGGLSADSDGALTLGWWNCPTLVDCTVMAATATPHGRVNRARVVASRAIQMRVADGAVGWESCGRHHCAINARLVLAGRRFGPRQFLGRGYLVTLRDDHHGDVLAVWDAPGGRVRAAVRPACARRFDPSRTLSAPGVLASTIRAAYSPDGTAVVAWSEHGRTSAAVNRSPECSTVAKPKK